MAAQNRQASTSLFSPIYRLKALTLNNMGCTYMKENKVHEALDYLR
jgi:hypothetical protein